MPITKTEKIKIIAKRRNIKLKEIAAALNMSPQNFNAKLNRDTLNDDELKQIEEILNCTYNSYFTLNDTGEKI